MGVRPPRARVRRRHRRGRGTRRPRRRGSGHRRRPGAVDHRPAQGPRRRRPRRGRERLLAAAQPGGVRSGGGGLAGRPALLHHHDLPWQRERFADVPACLPDPLWLHVATSELSAGQLAERGVCAAVVHNAFDTEAAGGNRHRARTAMGIGPGERLLLQPPRPSPQECARWRRPGRGAGRDLLDHGCRRGGLRLRAGARARRGPRSHDPWQPRPRARGRLRRR